MTPAPTRPTPGAAAATVALVERLFVVLTEFGAPDDRCRALRSIYSRRGVCNQLPAGAHHPACDAWVNAICDARDWLEQHRPPEARQLALVERT